MKFCIVKSNLDFIQNCRINLLFIKHMFMVRETLKESSKKC